MTFHVALTAKQEFDWFFFAFFCVCCVYLRIHFLHMCHSLQDKHKESKNHDKKKKKVCVCVSIAFVLLFSQNSPAIQFEKLKSKYISEGNTDKYFLRFCRKVVVVAFVHGVFIHTDVYVFGMCLPARSIFRWNRLRLAMVAMLCGMVVQAVP